LAAALFGQKAPSKDVVAEVDGVEITASEIGSFDDESSNRTKEMLFESQRRFDRKIRPEEAKYRLDEVIDNKLMLKEAKSAGIENDPKLQAVYNQLKENALLQFYYENVIRAEAKPTADEVRKEYDETDRYMRPPTARVITIWSPDEEEAKKAIDKLNTIDLTADKNNEYNIEETHLPEGDQVENYRQKTSDQSSDEAWNDPRMEITLMLLDAKAGDIVGPVGSEGNFITVKVVEKLPAGKTPFDQIKDQIEREMTDHRFREAVDKKMEELRSKATITVYNENLNKAFE
jgi:peptidylprolyl isomerase